MPKSSYYLPQRRLVSQSDSALNERPRVPRAQFLNRYGHLTTLHSGFLTPFLAEEVLPGDHFKYQITPYVRMATPLFPLFSNIRVDTHLFFVPNRLVWDNWVRFMGEQDSPGDSIAYTIPQVTSPTGGFPINDIHDHFGLPTVGQVQSGQVVSVNSLPLRAYKLIWNIWFRDQNNQNGLSLSKGDGPDASNAFVLKRRAKSHDYFTKALPAPQKFTPPTVPLAGLAPVMGIGAYSPGGTGVTGPGNFIETDNPSATYDYYAQTNVASAIAVKVNTVDQITPEVFADLSQVTGFAINTFRTAAMIQELLERDARGGTRYPEKLLAHFDVRNPDFRLQRPEYIGGGQSPINVTPIAQTAPTTGVPLGALGGTGTAVGHHSASYAATEHGWIIGLISTKSELMYQQGIPRKWSRLTQYDHYTPELAHLGEQAILRQEIFASGVDADDQLVFGYGPRWDEYRSEYSIATGMFRSTTAGNIDEWHTGQLYVVAPTLGDTFIQDNPPMERVLAAGSAADNQQFIADIHINRVVTRPMPAHSTPSSFGRF